MGRGYVQTYLARPNTVVLAAVRDPAHPTAKSLADLAVGPGSQLHVLKLDCSIPGDATKAVEVIATQLKITSLDVVIGNAGIVGSRVHVSKVPLEECLELCQVNAWSHLELFQALFGRKMLQPGAKFVVTGTGLASVGLVDNIGMPFHDASYSFSKAIVHFMGAKLSAENPDLIVFVLDPG